jgi:predicted nuclease of restriction endonuclease-like (RecB) superfamily
VAAQIDTNAHAWHGKALTNFSRTLPPETSDLAQQVLKDPYQFDFLTLRAAAHERDVERALVTRVKDLLLELGKGFSFIASQHHLEVGGQDCQSARKRDPLSASKKDPCADGDWARGMDVV